MVSEASSAKEDRILKSAPIAAISRIMYALGWKQGLLVRRRRGRNREISGDTHAQFELLDLAPPGLVLKNTA